jgi:hypothetical protein
MCNFKSRFRSKFYNSTSRSYYNVGFLQSDVLVTVENQFYISNEINIREFFNANRVSVSGQTIEGFPYITYSKVSNDKINTHGIIFISGEFIKLSFEEKTIQGEVQVKKR